jgi:hypothetical protein
MTPTTTLVEANTTAHRYHGIDGVDAVPALVSSD